MRSCAPALLPSLLFLWMDEFCLSKPTAPLCCEFRSLTDSRRNSHCTSLGDKWWLFTNYQIWSLSHPDQTHNETNYMCLTVCACVCVCGEIPTKGHWSFSLTLMFFALSCLYTDPYQSSFICRGIIIMMLMMLKVQDLSRAWLFTRH